MLEDCSQLECDTEICHLRLFVELRLETSNMGGEGFKLRQTPFERRSQHYDLKSIGTKQLKIAEWLFVDARTRETQHETFCRLCLNRNENSSLCTHNIPAMCSIFCPYPAIHALYCISRICLALAEPSGPLYPREFEDYGKRKALVEPQ